MHSAQTAILSQVELSPGELLVGGTFDATGVTTAIILLPGEFTGNWDDAIAWAKDQAGDLPNRVEQAMLWANHRDQFQKDWYWSCEAPESGWAWFQDFRDGGQLSCYRNDELRARAVRRLIIQ
jgi:hypothetical protein